MAQDFSFDIVSRVDFQEVENAMGQTRKEISQRYDFKNSRVEIAREKEKITIVADDEFRMRATNDILSSKFVKRGVPLKNVEESRPEAAFGGSVRQTLTIKAGITADVAKLIVKQIKEKKLKVQTSVQSDQIRVTGRSKDVLQNVIVTLKKEDFGLDLQFVNYR